MRWRLQREKTDDRITNRPGSSRCLQTTSCTSVCERSGRKETEVGQAQWKSENKGLQESDGIHEGSKLNDPGIHLRS